MFHPLLDIIPLLIGVSHTPNKMKKREIVKQILFFFYSFKHISKHNRIVIR